MSKDPIEALLRQAKTLHKQTKSDSMSQAMPVLRRLVNTQVFPETQLSQLFHQRENIQRKHLLRMLALEAGFNSWEQFKPALQSHPELLPQDLHSSKDIAKLNLWFSTEREALAYAQEHGGEVKRHGAQAVVVNSQE